MLVEGRSGIQEVPPDRWDRDRFYDPNPSLPGTMDTKWGGFLENLDLFDASFWGITPREARRMDPQQRWLLEAAWEAIEDSGTASQTLQGADVGVYVGIAGHDYGVQQARSYDKKDAYTNSGCTFSIASNRISYQFDLKGPSVSVDTACSSSLVTVWMACESIWSGCCTAALAGGVSALITPDTTIGFSKASMLSPSGQCFAFDARADGYVRGEGVGVVYLKPLRQALADRDRIYAVIRAAACNQDGHTSSMTVPGVEGQSDMLRRAYRMAGFDPGRVVYMESHGTGTPVGDPIEATALGRVLAEGRPQGQKCLIGSVKTNIGHLEAASGIAGLIKAALVLHNRTVPANLNFETPNSRIPFDDLRLEVASQLQPLPQQDGLEPVAAVNSFGFGGTNAHVVLEAAPEEDRRVHDQTAERPYLLPVSARDEESLRRYAEAYRGFLTDLSLDLADVCYSAGERKGCHDHRLVVIGQDSRQMCQRLDDWLDGAEQVEGFVDGRSAAPRPAPVFVFTGQGAQWWAMGRQLLDREPVFRRTIEEIDAVFQPLSGWSLLEGMSCPEQELNINRTDVAQPAIFALQASLVELWKSWGVQPGKVIGHSVGEVAAAYCAGVYTLEDAVKIVFHRSRLQQTTGGHGRMLAAGMSADEARQAISNDAERVEIAAINSPSLLTISGDTKPLEHIAARLEQASKFTRWLRIQYAFHTHQMDPIQEELLEVLADIRPRQSQIPFISTVAGGVLDGERMDAQYWWNNVRQPVLFGPAISGLMREDDETFLELGPHPALESSIKECLAEQGRSGNVFHSLRRETDESMEMVTNLAGLHVRGVPIDWAAVNQSGGNLVRLPRYPWHYESFWLETKESKRSRLAPAEHPLLGLRVTAAEPTWQFELDPRRFTYLNDHRFWDSIVFPAAGYGEIGLALARTLFADDPHVVEDLLMHKALFVSEAEVPTVQVVFDETDKSFSVYSGKEDKEQWQLNAQGRLTQTAPSNPQTVDLGQLQQRLHQHCDRHEFYDTTAKIGYQFGEDFRHLQNVWRVEGEALAEIAVPEAVAETVGQYHFHPAVMDACFHAFLGVRRVPGDGDAKNYFYLPHSIRRIRLYCDKPPTRLWAHARLVREEGDSRVVDIHAYDDRGQRVADILGLRVNRVEQKRSADDVDNCYYQFQWKPLPHEQAPPDNDQTEASTPALTYVVLADEGGVADLLVASLRNHGYRAICVRHGSEYQQESEAEFVVAADSEDDLRRVFAEAAISDDELTGVVHCWSLDHPSAEAMSSDELQAAQETGVLSALRLVHTSSAAPPPRVWFVVRDVHHVRDGDRSGGLAAAPLVGLLRVANNEHPQCCFTLVDLDARPHEDEVEDLFCELTAGDDELEVAYRDSNRHALRLGRVRADQLSKRTFNAVNPDGSLVPYRLETDRPGILANLSLNETMRRPPGPDEVEVRVRAGGVNFRDVMKALGTYPGNPVDLLWFGDDFAGTVERVGENVRHLRPGDEVAGMAPYCFRAYATVDASIVFKKPTRWSFQQAATVPTVFLTAHYALNHLARLEVGEKVLIHGGTGGVGQAAVQIAQHLGLEIFATAGTPEKRRLLSEMGVPHVMNSRTLEFADQVLEITEGRGVDAVLNSFAGDFIPKSLSVLAPFGRFLEIGKVDVYRNTKVGLQRLKDNITYHVIDLAQHLQHKPAFVATLFAELAERFAAGDYQPLSHTEFPITEVVEAFRFMAQGKHVGKNVLSFDVDEIPVGLCTEDQHRFRAEATYLITGGAGGFCLEVAKWMAQHGARHLVLMSRSGPRDEGACREIDELRAAGTTVVDARGDVTRLEDVQRIVGRIRDELPPLKGVIHGAMVLDDALLVSLDEPSFNKALEPKMMGAWNLHTATRDLPLEHFVCFSSFSTMIGGPKQSNYNAGNSFLDALAHYRRALGLPALTINWGALTGAGFVARNEKTAEYLDKIGMKSLRVDEALRAIDRMMLLDPVQIAAARADWRSLSKASPIVARANTFAAVASEGGEAEQGSSLRTRLRAAAPDERPGLIEDCIAAEVAGVFGIATEKLDREAPLTNVGLDSLMAVELTNRVESELGASIPMASLLGGPSIKSLAQTVEQLLTQELDGDEQTEEPEGSPASADAAPDAPSLAATESGAAQQALQDIDQLSDHEVDDMLSGLLNK